MALALRDSLVASHGVVSESFVSTALFTWCTAHTEAAQRGRAPEGKGPPWLTAGMWEVSLGLSGAGEDGVLCMGPDGAYFHPWGHPFPRVRHAGEGGRKQGEGGGPRRWAGSSSAAGLGAAGAAHADDSMVLHLATLRAHGYKLLDAVPWLHVAAPSAGGIQTAAVDPSPCDLRRDAVDAIAAWLATWGHTHPPRRPDPVPTLAGRSVRTPRTLRHYGAPGRSRGSGRGSWGHTPSRPAPNILSATTWVEAGVGDMGSSTPRPCTT